MKKIKYLFVFASLFAFIYGCAHTNNFNEHNMSGKKYMFKQYVNGDITGAWIDISTGSYSDKGGLVSVILTELGEEYAEGKVRDKLERCLKADTITKSISNGIQEGLKTYYLIETVDSLNQNPDFIVETKFNKIIFSSDAYGVSATMRASVRVIDRKSAKTVWLNSESYRLPLKDVVISYFGGPYVRTTASVVNLIRLLDMKDEEIKYAIDELAKEVGFEHAETLREDISGE